MQQKRIHNKLKYKTLFNRIFNQYNIRFVLDSNNNIRIYDNMGKCWHKYCDSFIGCQKDLIDKQKQRIINNLNVIKCFNLINNLDNTDNLYNYIYNVADLTNLNLRHADLTKKEIIKWK